jgi:hypothetical protein
MLLIYLPGKPEAPRSPFGPMIELPRSPLIPGGPGSPFMNTKRRIFGRIAGPRSPRSPYI